MQLPDGKLIGNGGVSNNNVEGQRQHLSCDWAAPSWVLRCSMWSLMRCLNESSRPHAVS